MSTTSVRERPPATQTQGRIVDSPEQSLAAATNPTPTFIHVPQVVNDRLDEWFKRYHVLSPAMKFLTPFAPGYAISASVVQLDPHLQDLGGDKYRGTDTYYSSAFMERFGKADVNDGHVQRAISLTGLSKISIAAGLSWTERSGRRDDRRIANYWEYFSEADMLTVDGQIITWGGTVEVDLRDGSPQIAGWSERRLAMARQFGLQLAESKSKNRVIRRLGLQQVYTVDELRKPFLVLRAVWVPDMSDPVIRQMVADRALHGRRTLYPLSPPAPSLPPADGIFDPEEPHALTSPDSRAPVMAGGVLPGPQPTRPSASANVQGSTPPLAAVVQAPDTEQGASTPVFVTNVEEKSGTTKGRDWTVYWVTFSDGKVAGTFDKGIAALARDALKNRKPVTRTLRTSESRPDKLEIVELMFGTQADLPLDGEMPL